MVLIPIPYSLLLIILNISGCGAAGSFDFDRCLWQMQGERKGAAVKICRRSKSKQILGTARVSVARGIIKTTYPYSLLFITSKYPGVAQLVARLTGGQEAAGSSPVTRTKKIETIERWSLFFCVCVRKDTISFASLLATSFIRRITSFRFGGHKTMLPSANSVVPRTNDVVIRANLCYNTFEAVMI